MSQIGEGSNLGNPRVILGVSDWGSRAGQSEIERVCFRFFWGGVWGATHPNSIRSSFDLVKIVVPVLVKACDKLKRNYYHWFDLVKIVAPFSTKAS